MPSRTLAQFAQLAYYQCQQTPRPHMRSSSTVRASMSTRRDLRVSRSNCFSDTPCNVTKLVQSIDRRPKNSGGKRISRNVPSPSIWNPRCFERYYGVFLNTSGTYWNPVVRLCLSTPRERCALSSARIVRRLVRTSPEGRPPQRGSDSRSRLDRAERCMPRSTSSRTPVRDRSKRAESRHTQDDEVANRARSV